MTVEVLCLKLEFRRNEANSCCTSALLTEWKTNVKVLKVSANTKYVGGKDGSCGCTHLFSLHSTLMGSRRYPTLGNGYLRLPK